MPGHTTGTFPSSAPTSGLITPSDSTRGGAGIPDFDYPDKFCGVDLNMRFFAWLRANLPRERTDGKPLQGVGVCVWRPEDRDWCEPWMYYALDANMEYVSPSTFTGNNAEQMLCVENAMRKGKFTLRLGLPSSAAVETHRHLRQIGDFCYDGCVIIGDVLGHGPVVSISGYTKEQDAEQAQKAGEYLTDEMQTAIDSFDSDSHYWAEGLTKEQLLEKIRAGITLNMFGANLDRTHDGHDGIAPNSFRPHEI